MAGGYEHNPSGIEGVVVILRDQQRQINALREAAGIRSAVINAAKGLSVTSSAGNDLGGIGQRTHIRFDGGEEHADVFEGILLQFDTPDGIPLLIAGKALSDGSQVVFIGDQNQVDRLSWLTADADKIALTAGEYLQIQAPRITLFDIPTVSSATYQMGYNFDGTDYSLCLITSSLKYKQDISDAPPAPAILDVQDRIWRDKVDVAADPDSQRWQYGAIAEEVHALGLTHLVAYKDGEPEALHYDRFGVALIPVVRELKATVATQAQLIADLIARLAALEAA